MMGSINQLKAVLVFIAIFHLVFGLGLMVSIVFQKAAIAFYGGTLEWTQYKPGDEYHDFNIFWAAGSAAGISSMERIHKR